MFSAYIVEDEEAARHRLEKLVELHPQLYCIGLSGRGKQALDELDQLKPQLLFLDIRLPDISGLDILKVLTFRPAVIFTTAYDQYAVEAFEHDAVDFLLKPFSEERFYQAVDKAIRKSNMLENQLSEQLKHLFTHLPAQMDYLTRLPAKVGDKIYILKTTDIIYFKSEDKVVTAYLEKDYFIVNYTLDELQQRLDPNQFIRIHRSTIANLNYVQSIEPLLGGTYLMRMNNQKHTELNVSRNAAKLIRQKLDW